MSNPLWTNYVSFLVDFAHPRDGLAQEAFDVLFTPWADHEVWNELPPQLLGRLLELVLERLPSIDIADHLRVQEIFMYMNEREPEAFDWLRLSRGYAALVPYIK